MLEFTIEDKTFSLPVSWEQVTVGQYLNIQAIEGQHYNQKLKALILEAVSGIPYETICKCSLSQIENMNSVLQFIQSPPEFKEWKLPDTYKLNGKDVEIPKDLKTESLGQRIAFEQIIFPAITATGDIVTVMDKAVAIYIQPTFTGTPFDEKEYAKVIPLVRESLLIEAHPIASFFFREFKASLKQNQKHSKEAQTLMQSMQE